ncbi:MAG: hypothetical protein AABM40_04290 [Chloroflexota bacterium]
MPKYTAPAADALARVKELDAHLLAEIFLEDPTTVVPTSGPIVP